MEPFSVSTPNKDVVFVWFVGFCQQHYTEITEHSGWILVQNRPLLTFGVDPYEGTDPGIFQDSVHIFVNLFSTNSWILVKRNRHIVLRWLVSISEYETMYCG